MAKALALDRESIAGRPMYVDRYVEKERDREKKQTAVVKEFKVNESISHNHAFMERIFRWEEEEEEEEEGRKEKEERGKGECQEAETTYSTFCRDDFVYSRREE